MKIAIVGCRPPKDAYSIPTYKLIVEHFTRTLLELMSKHKSLTIVSGGAQGIDQLAAQLARRYEIPLIELRPNYDRYGKSAPLERNTLIVAEADEVHAWPAPWSRGTWDTIRKASGAGKPCTVHEPYKEES